MHDDSITTYPLASGIEAVLQSNNVRVREHLHDLQLSVLKACVSTTSDTNKSGGSVTLKRLSWSTFLMATTSFVPTTCAWNTTPKLPFPITLSALYETPFALITILSDGGGTPLGPTAEVDAVRDLSSRLSSFLSFLSASDNKHRHERKE